ncbi:MAG: UDP-N-acetylglucosamine 2-epimerase (non-hydrolyzing) [Cyclobacteriaceae bacterium]|nr:UDP-N-acetylglucosamine 2-epimerase (non-hydrolyzing) [Cyclobacteriaceae bacterium]
MRVVTVLGARPQFIKAATVSRAFKDSGIDELIVHTGQHFDRNMSNVFFEEMDIPLPHYQLEISGLSHGAMTGRMLEQVESVLLKEKPNMVMVYGDTNSTLAGSLAASKLHIPVAHVEAGLRSFEMRMPEEINRILTDRISKLLFCPTDTAVQNLKKEGFDSFDCEIIQCGDVMYDAVLHYRKLLGERSNIIETLDLGKSPFVLVTIHRAENTDDVTRLTEIVEALNAINRKTKVVLPLHPRTRGILEKNNIKLDFSTIEPVGYFDMLSLLENCEMVMTDSGGLQKEAYFFSKYCLTLREQTEWVELIEAGVNSLVAADTDKILSAFEKAKQKPVTHATQLYGDGTAAQKIAQKLGSF